MASDHAPAQPGSSRTAPDPAAAEQLRRLCGQVDGRRVLELGAADGALVVALARQGAHVIAVEPTLEHLDALRRRCADEGVRVELHHADLAELAFVRADAIDVVVSPSALTGVADLNRVFRQAHRVLRQDGPLVCALAHPASHVVVGEGGAARIGRSYFDRDPVRRGSGDEHHHTVTDVFTGLVRGGFRVDTLLEPQPATDALVPRTLVVRARKEGR